MFKTDSPAKALGPDSGEEPPEVVYFMIQLTLHWLILYFQLLKMEQIPLLF